METTLLSVEEYLHTVFPDGDYEYVDGQLVEMGTPTTEHGNVLFNIGAYLRFHYKNILWSVGEARMPVTPTRYRIPDVCAGLYPMPPGIITQPPFIGIEIVSTDERASELDKKVPEYLDLGVPNIWVCYPETRHVISYAPGTATEVNDVLRTKNPDIEIPVNAIFGG